MGNMWDERYSAPGYAYGTEPNDFLAQVAPGLQKGTALCLGEGEGRNALYLAQQGFQVTAVDAVAAWASTRPGSGRRSAGSPSPPWWPTWRTTRSRRPRGI